MTGLAGLGMFEANAIQFGMDQMLEASSEQLSSFIHWYFWFAHLGSLFVFYSIVIVSLFMHRCRLKASLFGIGMNFPTGLVLFAIAGNSTHFIYNCDSLFKSVQEAIFVQKEGQGIHY